MFPNVYVVVRLFLTLPVTNCEGERSMRAIKEGVGGGLSRRQAQGPTD